MRGAGVVPLKYRVARCREWVRAIGVIGAGVIVGAVVAPWVYRVGQEVAWVREFPFRRVFDRVVVVCVVGGLAICWGWLGIEFRPRVLFRRKRAVRRWVVWMVVGVMSIAVLTLAQVWAGLRVERGVTVSGLVGAGVAAFGSAVAVGVIEELAFRGFLLHALMERLSRYGAVLVSSVIFAGLHVFTLDHFLRPIKQVVVDGMRWDAGFRLMGLFFVPLREPGAVVPGLVGLFLAGWLLAELTVRTRTLWAAMGLHTGWVFAIKVLGKVWKYVEPPARGAGPVWLFGEKYAATGVLGWLIVGVLIVVVNGLALYVVYRGAEQVVGLLPRGRLMQIGRMLGRVAFWVAWRQRRIALENVCAAFPERGRAECYAIARESFETLGMVALELLDFPRLARCFFEYVKPEGLEHVEAVRARGQAIVFFTGHYGNWEIFPLGCGLLGYPFSGVARPFHNEWIYGRVLRVRCASGVRILDKRNIAGEVLRRLRAGEMVGFVGDQYAGEDGVATLFFGRRASTSGAMAAFARKTGAALIAAFDHVRADGSHRPVIYPAFEVGRSEDPERDIAEATQRLMDYLEAEIRRDPGQWLWMHRKWRAPRSAVMEREEMKTSNPKER
ncbi:MAG: CPBP family glutamic-type intramembrane protease [bacterium]|nr:CPBP family glutamic-type intramembrane protease [bacterium]